LDDSQVVHVKELFVQHSRVQAQTRLEFIKPLLERSADIFAAFQPGSLEGSLALSSLIREERPAVIKRLEQLDQRFYQTITELLTEEQLAKMPRVTSMRVRATIADGDARYPGSDVDLLVLLFNVLEVNQEHVIVDHELFDSLVTVYGDEMAFAVNKRIDAQIDSRTDGSVLQKQYLAGRVNPSWAKDRLRAMRRKRVQAEERLHDINVHMLQQLDSCIDPESYQLLEHLWQVNVYPPVYPDPTNTDALYSHAIAITDLDDQVRDQLMNLHAAILMDHETVNAKMVERVLEYRKEHGIEWPGDAYRKYEPEIIELHEKRMALAKQDIEWLRASVSVDTWAQLKPYAESHIAEMEQWEFIPDHRRGNQSSLP